MNFEEAMKAARQGHKVAPKSLAFFVYYEEEASDFGCYYRVTPGKFGRSWVEENYYSTPYEKMMSWVVYKKDPLETIKKLVKRVFGKNPKLRLNRSLANPS